VVNRLFVCAGAVGLAVLASGCGADNVVGGTAPQPGVAAAVGDSTLTLHDADVITAAVCDGLDSDPQSQATTRALVAQGVVARWVTIEAARSLAEDEGIDADAPPFDRKQIPGWDDLDEDEQEIVGDYADGLSYLQTVGSQLDAKDTDEQGLNLDGVDIVVNPRYDLRLDDAHIVPASNDLSEAVSQEASAAATDQPSAEQLKMMPDDQVCGTPAPPQPEGQPLPIPGAPGTE
jgi:hypothetical protein